MLKNLFEEKRCFKLVCGAGNEDADEVEKLVTIYSKAGCNFFDVCAKAEIVDAAKRGLKRAGIEKERYICVSVGIDGDPHITKAKIDSSKCVECRKCESICPAKAIMINNGKPCIDREKCIRCFCCQEFCPKGAMKVHRAWIASLVTH